MVDKAIILQWVIFRNHSLKFYCKRPIEFWSNSISESRTVHGIARWFLLVKKETLKKLVKSQLLTSV